MGRLADTVDAWAERLAPAIGIPARYLKCSPEMRALLDTEEALAEAVNVRGRFARLPCVDCGHPLSEHRPVTGCRHELAPATAPGRGAESRSAVLCPCRS